MSVPPDELAMLRSLVEANPAQPAQQPQGMIQTDPGNLDAFMQNQRIMQQLGGSSADIEKRAALDKQMQMARYLGAGADMPKGQHIPGYMGGVYVAPNVLQSLGAGGSHALGAIMAGKAAQQEQEMARQEAINRTRIMEMYAREHQQSPLLSPDIEALRTNMQNPLENYNFGPQGGPPVNTNLQPPRYGQAPPRQGTADDFVPGT